MRKNLERWLGRTAYQIMPDRFCKLDENLRAIPGRTIKAWNDRMPNWQPGLDGEYTNDYFYCGNLKGITSKLDYLNSLGFDMIYLTPIESSYSYHHYDPMDHMEIDQWLGTWEEFSELCNQAHERGMLIVVDLVFNHTGIHSIYFDNPKYSHWYKRDSNGEVVRWWNFKDLPECDTLNEDYQKEMTRVVEKYLQMGADGIRLDLGENLPKEFLVAIGKVKEKYPETIFIGEMWGIATDKSHEDAKIFDLQLDSVMNYPVADAILRWTRWGKFEHFMYIFERVYREYPIEVQNVLLNNIATHDTPTTVTMLGGEKMNDNVFDKQIWDIEAPWRTENGFDTYSFRKFEADHDVLEAVDYIRAKSLLRIAIAIMYMLPGIPCIFQGTEIADTGYKDPFNRKPYNWNKPRDEITKFVSDMGFVRKENCDILKTGQVRIARIDEKVLIIERFTEKDEHIILAVNRTPEWQYIMLPGDNSEFDVVYCDNGCSNTWLTDYGMIIVRQ